MDAELKELLLLLLYGVDDAMQPTKIFLVAVPFRHSTHCGPMAVYIYCVTRKIYMFVCVLCV